MEIVKENENENESENDNNNNNENKKNILDLPEDDEIDCGRVSCNDIKDNRFTDNRYTEVENNILLNPIEGYDQNLNEVNNNLIANNQNNPQTNTDNNDNSENKQKKTAKEKYNFKIILLGDIGTGKTSLITRYVNNNDQQLTQEIINKIIVLDESTCVKVSIHDTTTMEKLGTFTKDYYRDAHGAIIVFDLCNQESFNRIKNHWIIELNNNAPKDVVYAIIGNKSDKEKERVVKYEDATSVAGDNLYYEVSAKNGNNVSLAIEQLVYNIIDKQNEEANNPDKVLRGKEGRKTMDLVDANNIDIPKGCCK